MENIKVARLETQSIDLSTAIKLLDEQHVAYTDVTNANWSADYPYKPEFSFRMAHNGQCLIIEYRVKETSIASVAGRDNGNVWEDSCCEFFSQLPGDDFYYNMECNCTGRLLIGCGPVREGRQLAPASVLDKVMRWSSLGSEDIALAEGDFTWNMVLVIPKEAWFQSNVQSFDGMKLKANIYKCGDKLSRPHFLSWNKVDIEKPDFHRPDFFGDMLMG